VESEIAGGVEEPARDVTRAAIDAPRAARSS
jgi:hypothetical protein